jgi:CubicO group peptidase (beta-lactamase class C family)
MNKVKTLLVKAAALIVLSLCCAVVGCAQDLAPKFDEYLSAAAKAGFSGSALVARDGKALFSKGYGKANEELDVANTPQTKFRIGSITKQFTAAAIMLLQERGKLSVSDPVCKYFTDCPATWSELTVHHLLTHTSGIPSYTNSPDYLKGMTVAVTNESLLARFKDKPLEFKPGEQWKYNNSGYFMLGIIIEKVSGESYESFLQKNLFEPLKLANTGYDRHDYILKNRATGYSQQNGKRINSLYLDMTQPGAAGALYSTVEDLFAWNEALFNDKLLTAKSREAMTTVAKNGYGYGLGMSQVHKRAMVSHGGGINGFSTMLARFPAEKVTVVVLRNADYGAPAPGKLSQDLAALLFGESLERPVAKVDPKLYDAYVGQYQLGPNFIITITRDGDRLLAQATGQPQFEIFPESETKFFLKVVEAQISFVKDAAGQVTELILHQGGEQRAMKIK